MGRKRADSLDAYEQDALHFQVTELIKAEEPIAMLACMHRVAERMTWRAVVVENREAAQKWSCLADALQSVALAISRPDLRSARDAVTEPLEDRIELGE